MRCLYFKCFFSNKNIFEGSNTKRLRIVIIDKITKYSKFIENIICDKVLFEVYDNLIKSFFNNLLKTTTIINKRLSGYYSAV